MGMYTLEGLSTGEITRRINAEGIPTRKASARWERSTVWSLAGTRAKNTTLADVQMRFAHHALTRAHRACHRKHGVCRNSR